ncbi:IS5 family transposase [Luteibacter sp. Sphag1AF]|nr:IS5 family transposase [Luteibacter sp. Sphag1AF]
MLRIHFLQQWYALSDPAVEEALYDSVSMPRFVGDVYVVCAEQSVDGAQASAGADIAAASRSKMGCEIAS